MKKIFFIAAMAVGTLCMASCSEDATSQSYGGDLGQLKANEVAFTFDGAAKSGVMSRAGSTVTSLSSFYVQATTSDNAVYFGAGTGEEFTFDGTTSTYRSAINRYWPTTGTLNFYASNYAETIGEGAVVSNYTCDGNKDWVTATVKAGEKAIPYPLTFQHVLSQIKISAQAKDATQNLDYKVVGVRLTTPSKGSYTFANATGGVGTWAVQNNQTSDYTYLQNMNGTFNPTAVQASGQTWTSTDYFNVLPVTDGTMTFDVQYQVIQNGKVIADYTGEDSKEVTVDAPNLLSGKIYTYNFVLSAGVTDDDAISFTMTMTDWANGGTTAVQVPQLISYFSMSNDFKYNIEGSVYNNYPCTITYQEPINLLSNPSARDIYLMQFEVTSDFSSNLILQLEYFNENNNCWSSQQGYSYRKIENNIVYESGEEDTWDPIYKVEFFDDGELYLSSFSLGISQDWYNNPAAHPSMSLHTYSDKVRIKVIRQDTEEVIAIINIPELKYHTVNFGS